MTPDQKMEKLTNDLSSLGKKYFIYKGMMEKAEKDLDALRYRNTMQGTRRMIESVLFEMYMIEVTNKITEQEAQCQENIQGSQRPAASDGGTVQDL